MNLTREDAFLRVSNARTGSLVGVSYAYLVALRVEVARWLEHIDNVMAAEDIAERVVGGDRRDDE